MEILMKVLQVILALSVLIVIHEFGHFTFAKLFGIRVEKFFLFFDIGDNGKLFNAERYASQFVSEPGDPSRNIGIRIVSRTAASMRYVSLVDL